MWIAGEQVVNGFATPCAVQLPLTVVGDADRAGVVTVNQGGYPMAANFGALRLLEGAAPQPHWLAAIADARQLLGDATKAAA